MNRIGELLAPGAHGGEGPRLAALLGIDPGEVLDLSQSLNPVAPDPVPICLLYTSDAADE